MPCWTVQKSEVALKGLNPELLKAALQALGFRINSAEYTANPRFNGAQLTADRFRDNTSVVIEADGTVTVRYSSARDMNDATLVNEVKRAYAVETVKMAAKKFGWKMEEKTATKFAVTRRF
jgi:hypothetical protein